MLENFETDNYFYYKTQIHSKPCFAAKEKTMILMPRFPHVLNLLNKILKNGSEEMFYRNNQDALTIWWVNMKTSLNLPQYLHLHLGR